jgi:hypothetical protein
MVMVVVILQLQPQPGLGLKQFGQSVENLTIVVWVIHSKSRVLPKVVEELRLMLGTGGS